MSDLLRVLLDLSDHVDGEYIVVSPKLFSKILHTINNADAVENLTPDVIQGGFCSSVSVQGKKGKVWFQRREHL